MKIPGVSHRVLAAIAVMAGAAGVCAAEMAVPASWSRPHAPFQLYGNTYYVGTEGLSAVLVTAREGHVLIDGTMAAGAGIVADNIRAAGFRIEDVGLILNTHAHFDHAGGIAELQRMSGAVVAASAASAKVLTTGGVSRDDPQYGQLPDIAPVGDVQVIQDGEMLRAGSLELVAHLTPGHTPGGTSWTWQSCASDRCVNVVYADSLSPISAPGYRYTDAGRDPNGVAQLESSFATLSKLPCDVLIAPHPEFFGMAEKLALREQAPGANTFIDPAGCQRYVEAARTRLQERIAEETDRRAVR